MLTLSDISKSLGGRQLFSDASLQVNRGERLGIVGPNGAGKTTLFSLIQQQAEPDAGAVSIQKSVTLGYLPQENAPVSEETVLELACAVNPEMARLLVRIRHEESGRSGVRESADSAHERFHALGGYPLQAKAKKILSGLSFRESDFDRPASEMSGGWVMRAHLARLLVQEPDLLLLDEPTNHLDLEALLWFQGYLKGYPGTILMISHDREFLNELVDGIVEIRQSRLIRYPGNYEDFLAQREAQESQQWAAYKNQQKQIAHLMEFVDRFRAKNTKATQAQSKLKQIERMEKVEAPAAKEKTIHFEFPQPLRGGLKSLTLSGVHHAYGTKVVYEGIDFQVERGQRVVLVGPNGAGKSTLLKLAAGVLPVQAGTRQLGHNVNTGYYSQYRVEMLQPERTVLEEAKDTSRQVTEQFVRTVLGCFLFSGDDVFKTVQVLSGGEKSRLALVKLLLDPPNLLLMDEPTTHLDIPSIDALVEALGQFQGTLVFISHDVYFIRQLANHVVHIDNGRLTHYPGGYQYYLDKSAASEREGLTAGSFSRVDSDSARPEKPRQQTKERKRIEAEQRQARSEARKAQQARVQELERQIHDLEGRQTELTAALEDPATYQDGARAVEINRELSGIVDSLERLTAEWESAATQLDRLTRSHEPSNG